MLWQLFSNAESASTAHGHSSFNLLCPPAMVCHLLICRYKTCHRCSTGYTGDVAAGCPDGTLLSLFVCLLGVLGCLFVCLFACLVVCFLLTCSPVVPVGLFACLPVCSVLVFLSSCSSDLFSLLLLSSSAALPSSSPLGNEKVATISFRKEL